ncbi:MAG: hypothetical protein JRN52_13600 [Nitrososphaerota archaeon]|nr:hypothetical protein [Nitrososphaerota archaeon]
MPSDTSTLSELSEIYLSMKHFEKSETPKSNRNSSLIQEVRNLKTAVIEIDRFLLAISSNLGAQKLFLNQGTCYHHERLGLVTWERGEVPCPVCERNKFIESQSKEVAQKLGFDRFPIWDAYFCLWDLPPLERKKRVEELGERIREINERKQKSQNEVK